MVKAEREEVMNIFDCAIKVEQRAKECYELLEKESTLPEMKSLFSLLAEAEQEHIGTLMRMKESTAAGAELAEPECSRIPLMAKDQILREVSSDSDFFIHAVHGEEEDIRYYEELAARAQDERLRQGLLLLAEEERKHLDVVENIYSFAEAPRTYLAWQEFGNLQEL
jgi:rubrerythrin